MYLVRYRRERGLELDNGETTQDEIVIVEAMDDDLDRDWWRNYRAEPERRFRQDEVVVRALAFEPL
ncbi:hypothetical protein BH23GEM5_BH23GEM5_06180 [soil metagenome]